jgi:hypothetical protein
LDEERLQAPREQDDEQDPQAPKDQLGQQPHNSTLIAV